MRSFGGGSAFRARSTGCTSWGMSSRTLCTSGTASSSAFCRASCGASSYTRPTPGRTRRSRHPPFGRVDVTSEASTGCVTSTSAGCGCGFGYDRPPIRNRPRPAPQRSKHKTRVRYGRVNQKCIAMYYIFTHEETCIIYDNDVYSLAMTL